MEVVWLAECPAPMDIQEQTLFASRTQEHLLQLLLLRVLESHRRSVQLVHLVGQLVTTNMWEPRSFVLLRRRRRHGQQQLRHHLVESRREWRALQVDLQERINTQVLHSFVLQTLLLPRQQLFMCLHPPHLHCHPRVRL